MTNGLRVLILCALGVLGSHLYAASPTLSLAGSWQVTLSDGTTSTLKLPGTLGDAKLGTPATQAVYGALTPRHQYIGEASYTKSFTVAPGMTGDYELFLERVMWKSEVLLDGKRLGSCDSLSTPHIYALPAGSLTPGAHTLTLKIDNRAIFPIGEKGHSYSDSMQTRWNGVIGEITLRPVNPLRRIRVFAPCGDTLSLLLPPGLPASEVSASLEGKTTQRLPAEAGKDEIRLRAPGVKPWSPESPTLYTLVLKWKGQELRERVGFRTFERKGNRLYLNGTPLFIRGNTENCHFPLTGYPATDKASWLAIFSTIKAEGANQIRCHSWTPPQAAFDAADELGLLLSPELIWIDGWMVRDHKNLKGVGRGAPEMDDFIRRELFRILDTYGNAPSFFSMSVGNELGSSDFNLLGDWMLACRAYDSRHLYAASSARQISKGDDFFVTHNYPGVGMVRERRREGTDWDYEDVYSRTSVPTVAHEIGQWPVFPEFERELPKYTGILRAWNWENLREESARAGVLRFNRAYARASLLTNLLMYKDEIESFMRTPSCAGLQLLGMQDYSGQGEALIGWLDSFYDRKPGAERTVPVSAFFAPTVCLARFAKYTWNSSETLHVKFVVHNYASKPLKGTIPWSFAGQRGVVRVEVPVGTVQTVGEVRIPLKTVSAPAQHRLTFGDNAWSLWVYPEKISERIPENVVYTDSPAEVQTAIRAGKRVLFNAASCANPKATLHSAFIPVYWGTTWFPGQRNITLGMVVQAQSRAFASFPTEDWQDWQWKHLVNGGTIFRLTGTDPSFTPLAMPVVDFHKPALAALLFEAQVDKARVLVSGVDLDASRPEARQLRRSLLDYVASDAFAPKGKIARPAFDALFANPSGSLAPRPQEFAKAVAYFECAAHLTQRGRDVPWRKRLDRAELVSGTYKLEGKGLRTWSDADGSYWVGDTLDLTLTGCTNIRGTLLVRFRDPNNNERTARGSFDGGRTFSIPAHAKSASNPTGSYWLKLPVDMEDFLDGALRLHIEKTSGPNVMIDRVVLLPHAED